MSNHYGLDNLGYTCATLVIDKEKQRCELEQSLKRYLSSNCSLKLKSMKPESLVIVDHHATVNQYTSLVHTARQAMEIIQGRIYIGVYNFRRVFYIYFKQNPDNLLQGENLLEGLSYRLCTRLLI